MDEMRPLFVSRQRRRDHETGSRGARARRVEETGTSQEKAALLAGNDFGGEMHSVLERLTTVRQTKRGDKGGGVIVCDFWGH